MYHSVYHMLRIRKSGEKERRLGLLRVEGSGNRGNGDWLLITTGFLPGGTKMICRLQRLLYNPVNQLKHIELYSFEWVSNMVCKLCLIKLLKNHMSFVCVICISKPYSVPFVSLEAEVTQFYLLWLYNISGIR